ncbi:MAG TPA: isoprenylcysteine carboxylmethyltransferase family protein, partial [Anaerolineales bacterium]|nr:isoprenylcysteine carboxylmethyltransferase family protein [Anaerolineales bacterium]
MATGLASDLIVKSLVILFAYLWGGVEIFQQIKQRRSPSGTSPSRDRGSLIVLFGCITLGHCLAIPVCFSPYGRWTWGQPYAQLIGLAFIVGGLFIRWSAMRTLASLFTYAVEIQTQHRLVEIGLYRWVRHPGYLGQCLVFVGIGLGLANALSLLGLLAPVSVAFIYRISVEERALLQRFGGAYEAYRRR